MKKCRALMMALLLLTLSGCSRNDVQDTCTRTVEECLLRASGIAEEDSYEQYMKWKKEGMLDEEGYYNDLGEYAEEYAADKVLSENSAEEVTDQKQIRVTFARNSYLTIEYFYDKDRREKIEGDFCYLNPGESIYASQPECVNPYTNAYMFSEFRVYEYDTDGNRSRTPIMSGIETGELTVPADYKGTELSVEPVGEYQRHKFSFEAYMLDKNGNHKAVVGGVWTVNGEQYIDEAELNTGEKYRVVFAYDPDEYYFVKSEQSVFYQSDGNVQFSEITSPDNDSSYSVELHPYINAVLEGGSGNLKYVSAIRINGREYELAGAQVQQLKVGDIVSIDMTDGYGLFCSQFPLEKPEDLGNGTYRYFFRTPEVNEEIRLRVSRTTLKIDLEKSVGWDISFDIEGALFSKTNCVYSKQGRSGNCTIVDSTIGAEEAVVISARNSTLEPGTALRLDITKKDSNDCETKEIIYIGEVPGSQTISVYENGSAANASKIYKSIVVKISLVEAFVYQQQALENGFLRLTFKDEESDAALGDGDIVDGSRKVEVVMEPAEGYYVTGKKVSEDCYRDTMEYSKFADNITEIISSHPIEKYIWVTFDTSDPYGNCVFKIDGKALESDSAVRVKAGQKITLDYTLTNDAYQIVRESEGIAEAIKDWSSETFHKNKESVSFQAEAGHDGTVISREDYIKVEKK